MKTSALFLQDITMAVNAVKNFIEDDRGRAFNNYYGRFTFSENKLRSFMLSTLKGSTHFNRVIKSEDGGRIIAGLSANLSTLPISHDIVANDIIFFSERGSPIETVLLLVNEYVKWATENDAKFIHLRTSTEYSMEKFEKFMQRMKFEKFEAGYARSI